MGRVQRRGGVQPRLVPQALRRLLVRAVEPRVVADLLEVGQHRQRLGRAGGQRRIGQDCLLLLGAGSRPIAHGWPPPTFHPIPTPAHFACAGPQPVWTRRALLRHRARTWSPKSAPVVESILRTEEEPSTALYRRSCGHNGGRAGAAGQMGAGVVMASPAPHSCLGSKGYKTVHACFLFIGRCTVLPCSCMSSRGSCSSSTGLAAALPPLRP